MAGNTTDLLNTVNHGVCVAVKQNLNDLLTVPALFAFAPETRAGAGKIRSVSGPRGLSSASAIGPGQHEHRPVLCILSDDRHQPGIVELNTVGNAHL